MPAAVKNWRIIGQSLAITYLISTRTNISKPVSHRVSWRRVIPVHTRCMGQKSKLLILREYANKTEKIGGTWTNMNSYG